MLNHINGRMVIVHTTIDELRRIVIEGGVRAATSALADCTTAHGTAIGGTGVA
jgi:hypothetical protein